jgi:hypothetical protein
LIFQYDLDLAYFGIPRGDGDLDRLDRMRGATRHLIPRHREKIERVAQALLKHKTLSADQVRAHANDVMSAEILDPAPSLRARASRHHGEIGERADELDRDRAQAQSRRPRIMTGVFA